MVASLYVFDVYLQRDTGRYWGAVCGHVISRNTAVQFIDVFKIV